MSRRATMWALYLAIHFAISAVACALATVALWLLGSPIPFAAQVTACAAGYWTMLLVLNGFDPPAWSRQ